MILLWYLQCLHGFHHLLGMKMIFSKVGRRRKKQISLEENLKKVWFWRVIITNFFHLCSWSGQCCHKYPSASDASNIAFTCPFTFSSIHIFFSKKYRPDIQVKSYLCSVYPIDKALIQGDPKRLWILKCLWKTPKQDE